MKISFIPAAVLAAAVFLAVRPAGAEVIPSKSHTPFFLGVLNPSLEEAAPLKADEGRTSFSFDYTSIFYFKRHHDLLVRADMELAQFTIEYRHGLGGGTEFGIAQPFFRAGGGFLDQYVLDYHQMTGLPDVEGQRESPRNRFYYRVDHRGTEWDTLKPYRIIHGDTPFWLKKELYRDERLTVSAKGVLEAPTSPASLGIGNGSWDAAVMAMADHNRGDLALHGNAGYAIPGAMDRGERYALESFVFLNTGASYRLWRGLHGVVQLRYSGVPYMVTDWYETTFGILYVFKNGRRLTVGFTEDLSRTSPDFTGHLSFSF